MPTTLALREGLNGLTAIAERELRASIDVALSPDVVREAVADLLPSLVDRFGSAAATYAADWYDDLRVELEVRGAFTAIPADIAGAGTNALAGWGVSPLYQAAPDGAAALTLIAGGLQRRIANAARSTVTGSSLADPQATGWQRVGHGGCAFCLMLINRGEVYSEASADFASHDHCHCAAVPAFHGDAKPVKAYQRSERSIKPVDRARVNRYLRSH